MRHWISATRWLAIGAVLVVGGWILGGVAEAAAGESSLAYFRQAKINWRQFEGQKLTIGLNKHQYTESLLPLIGEFEALTGIKVDYLILPENEYGAKLTADLSQQRGEFTVIMAGAMRNWGYVPPGWMMPLDDFLKNPKLTDPAWFKLDDFFPGLIAANRWNGKFAGGMGEGPLWSIPVMSESYILAYRKDIFDQHNIKVPRTYEEMAEAARQVKQKAGIDGLVSRGTANFQIGRAHV
jgi:multiple sugar transport system substrate-binding protein